MKNGKILSLSEDRMVSLLEQFLDHLSLEKGLSSNTQMAYRHDLKRLILYLEDAGIHEIGQSRTEHVRNLIRRMASLGMAGSSIARNISAFRMFYRYLVSEGIIVSDPTEHIENPKKERSLPGVLEIHEVETILNTPDLGTPIG